MGFDGVGAVPIEEPGALLFGSIRADLLDEYRQNHNYPWIIGYSGGKDKRTEARGAYRSE